MPGPTVFLSYSHRDEAWKDRVVAHLGSVATLDLWEDRRIGAGSEWRAEIEAALASASVAVLLISADFLSSAFIRDVELPALFARRSSEGIRVIPLIVHSCAWLAHPWLPKLQAHPKDGRPLAEGDENQINRDLTSLALELHKLLRTAPQRNAEFVPLPPERLSLARMPTTREFLFGRETEIAELNRAWNDPTIHVVTVVAPGGVGKSALVNHWLGKMGKHHYRGAERVWAWSFYSQGSSGQAQSAEEFFREALAEFGDPDPSVGSPFQRGERLARMFRASRTLLILDGLEPLQYPPGQLAGRLKDQGLVALLKNLAAGSSGLCVVTTREPIAELASREGTTAHRIDLRALSDEAGEALLRMLGVNGTETELRQTVREFGGHSLSILLLGNYLRQVCNGDVRQRDKLKLLEQDSEEGGHASRVLAAYESWLGEGKELSILRILGLFDRPADADSLEALRAEPAIQGLTETLLPRDDASLQWAIARLRELGLLSPGSGSNQALDTHPLVRDYFGTQLRSDHSLAWREGNLRLYEHLKKKAPDLPETFNEMEPLYAAVVHGCRAGKCQEAFDQVYRRRIQRGDEVVFSTKRLGALGAELAALASFFVAPWELLLSGLEPCDQAYLFNAVAFRLHTQGRLAEAVAPMHMGLEMRVRQESWMYAAVSAGNLSELAVTLGRLPEAIDAAEQSVELADRSKDEFWRVSNRATRANVLDLMGRTNECDLLFREVEEIQAKRQPEFPQLYSLEGYQFCDRQLASIEAQLAEAGEVIPEMDTGRLVKASQSVLVRAERSIRIAENARRLLDLALDHLALGRTHHFLLDLEEPFARDHEPTALRRQVQKQAAEHLDLAVDGLRHSAREDHLPRGLLARAAFHRTQANFPAAASDLADALEIAERGGMRLFECDAHLEWARLCRALGDLPAAREHLAKATALVEATGYHRRDREVAALIRQLA